MNSIDWSLLIKVIPTLVGIFSIGRVMYDITSGMKNKLREEYRFAKEFLEQSTSSKLHPFVQEKGYQAIAGSVDVTQKEIEYILSLSNPANRLKDYKNSRHLFEKIETTGAFKLVYKKRYQLRGYRFFLKTTYLICYVLFAFLAALPFIFPEWFGQQGMLALGITIPLFGSNSLISLLAYGKLKAAERLTENMACHTSNIILKDHSIKYSNQS